MTAHAPTIAPADGVFSHCGRVRPVNEDSYGSFRTALAEVQPAERERVLAAKGWLYVVADGMGGHEHGDVASATAVQQICGAYYAALDELPEAGLRRALAQANSAIYSLAQVQQRPRARSMGTTAVCAVICGARLTLAHIGDSRAYLLRQGVLAQLTTDHDWITGQMQTHGWSRAETLQRARQRGTRGVLLRALGVQASAEPDIVSYDWRPGDVLLLCTDGLHGLVGDAEIAQILAAYPAPRAAHELIGAANAAGGHDNSTALVVCAAPPAARGAGALRRAGLAQWAAVLGAGLLLLAGLRGGGASQPPALAVSNAVLELAGLPTLEPTVELLPTATATTTPTATATTTPAPTATRSATATAAPISRPVSQPTVVRQAPSRPAVAPPAPPAPANQAPPAPPAPTAAYVAPTAPPPTPPASSPTLSLFDLITATPRNLTISIEPTPQP